MVHFWLRHEVKPGEERVILTPSDVKKAIDAGIEFSVERSPTRCIPDAEYEKVGCKLVESESWYKDAPADAYILGLKELPDNDDNLSRKHIFFAHCYKDQGGWEQVLSKFTRGKGLLWDLEFLVDENGRRVAAFGRAAGIVGMATGLITWCHQRLGTEVGPLTSWSSTAALVENVKDLIKQVQAKTGTDVTPSSLVIGALGRCGGGSVWFAEQCGLTATKWDMAETKNGGPFEQLLEVDVLVNCIYLSVKIPPFLTSDMLARPGRKLSVMCDVSCDYPSPNNPLPIYNDGTVMTKPVLNVIPAKGDEQPFDVIAIDHLPSLIPSDSSAEFSGAILPHLLDLGSKGHGEPVWARAEKLFGEHCERLRATGYKNIDTL